jgi:hypothetical protein
MWFVVLIIVAQSDSRYLSGASPHPLNQVGPVDESPGVNPCSVTTLRQRAGCTFEGSPRPSTDPAGQAEANLKLARAIGGALCRERAEAAKTDARDRLARVQACITRLEDATSFCTLDGVEALLDATGHFSPRAQSCYVELAGATQLAATPEAPVERRAEPPPAYLPPPIGPQSPPGKHL